jgi:hypothetical protein
MWTAERYDRRSGGDEADPHRSSDDCYSWQEKHVLQWQNVNGTVRSARRSRLRASSLLSCRIGCLCIPRLRDPFG